MGYVVDKIKESGGHRCRPPDSSRPGRWRAESCLSSLPKILLFRKAASARGPSGSLGSPHTRSAMTGPSGGYLLPAESRRPSSLQWADTVGYESGCARPGCAKGFTFTNSFSSLSWDLARTGWNAATSRTGIRPTTVSATYSGVPGLITNGTAAGTGLIALASGMVALSFPRQAFVRFESFTLPAGIPSPPSPGIAALQSRLFGMLCAAKPGRGFCRNGRLRPHRRQASPRREAGGSGTGGPALPCHPAPLGRCRRGAGAGRARGRARPRAGGTISLSEETL
jgi:hypothetical protein